MKRTTTKAMIAKADDLAERMQKIAALVPLALQNALDYLPSPVSNGMGESTSGGDKSTLDNRVIDNRSGNIRRHGDPTAGQIQQLNVDMQIILRAATRMRATAQAMISLTPEEAQRLAEAADISRGSECVNPACRTWITGFGEDRARDGRCNPCREYRNARKREGKPLEDRPHRLVHRAPEAGCSDCGRVYAEAPA